MIHRRTFLRGLFAAPAIIAANSLMPIRGIIMPIAPIIPMQTTDVWMVYPPEFPILEFLDKDIGPYRLPDSTLRMMRLVGATLSPCNGE